MIGATLDRNGLRPGRWLETTDGWVVMASETGVLDIPASQIKRKGRLQPGKLFLVDLEEGRIVPDADAKQQVATRRPYGEWYEREHVQLADLPRRTPRELHEPLRRLQLAFGYTQEDMKVMLAPLAANGEEAIGSMGNDTPLAVLSERRPLLYSYFKQLFAQVTNPPIDPIREAVVMSVRSLVGSERNLLDETPEHARQLVIDNPILRDDELESCGRSTRDVFKAHTVDITWPVDAGPEGLDVALERICAEADRALSVGTNILILSDRAVGPERVAVPSLLAVGAIHHHLVRAGTRLQAGLVVESGEPRSVQSMAVLIGYGAAAVNPYLMLATIDQLVAEGRLDLSQEEADERALKAIGKGLLKTISKMGISTLSSYCGAQVFEAVGLSPELIEKHFTGTAVAHRRDRARSSSPKARSPVTACLPGERRRAPARRGPVRLAARRRTPPVEPRDDRAPAARRAWGRPSDLRAVRRARQQRLGAPLDASRPAALRRPRGRCRSTRSSLQPRSSSASRPARCRSARSRARRTRRWPSR